MAYLSYVFTVQSHRKNSYRLTTGFEVRTVAAENLEVFITDQQVTPPVEVELFATNRISGTSIIVGPNHHFEFKNSGSRDEKGYFGAVT